MVCLRCSHRSIWLTNLCSCSALLKPSAHMLPWTVWSNTGLRLFPTTWCWLSQPADMTGVSASARGNGPGGCGRPFVVLLCKPRMQSPWRQFVSGVLASYSDQFATWRLWSAHILSESGLGLYALQTTASCSLTGFRKLGTVFMYILGIKPQRFLLALQATRFKS